MATLRPVLRLAKEAMLCAVLAGLLLPAAACSLSATSSDFDPDNPGAAIVGDGELRLLAVLPNTARAGRRIALRGDGFPNTADGDVAPSVTIGGVEAQVLASARTLILATVPGDVVGVVDVRVGVGRASAGPVSMTVLAPVASIAAVESLRTVLTAGPEPVTHSTTVVLAFDLEQRDE